MGTGSGVVRRVPLLLALVLAVGVVAFLLGRATAPDNDSARERPASRDTVAPNPTPDEFSAIDAATRFAQVMTGPSAGSASYIDEMEAIAGSQWKGRAQELARNGIEFVTDRYGQGGSVEFHPVKYRLRSYAQDSAVVDIWGVVLGSGPKLDGIEESWVTGSVSLVWEQSQWKVSGQSSKGGPTPELLKTEEEGTVQEILDDFIEYRDAPDS